MTSTLSLPETPLFSRGFTEKMDLGDKVETPHPHLEPCLAARVLRTSVSASVKPESTLFSQCRGRMSLEVHMPQVSGPQVL